MNDRTYLERNIREIRAYAPQRNIDYLNQHANFVRKILRRDWDWWSVGEGDEGVGKSAGSIWYAMKVGWENFSIEDHVCYEPIEFLHLVDEVPQYGVIVVDEAGEAMFNRDFNTQMNKAIVKTSQQCRDRNLLIILNVPSLDLIDSKLIRRVKTYTIYEAPGFERGRSIWHRPQKQRYARKVVPWFDVQFIYWFADLPRKVREEYKEMKSTKGKERVQKYIEQLEREEERNRDVDPHDIVDKIRRMPEEEKGELMSARGGFSRDKIRYKFQCPEQVARTVAAGLSIEED